MKLIIGGMKVCNKHFVVIDNELFNMKYGAESILLISVIQKNLLVRGTYVFNLNYIYDNLNIDGNNTRQKNKIKNCLVKLQKGSIITSDININNANNNQLIFVDIKIPKDNYTIVYDVELDTIINYNQGNIYNLYNLFVFLKYRIGIKGYCYWNQDDIANAIGLKSRKAVSKMIDVLSDDLKLIKVDNIGVRLFNNGNIKESNNIYVLNIFIPQLIL